MAIMGCPQGYLVKQNDKKGDFISMIQYRALSEHELCRDFIRHQVVTKCWRKEHNEWLIKDAPFIDNWTESDYDFLVS